MLGLKNLAMLPSYFHIFVHQRKKARLRPELSPKFLSILGPNPTRKARPDLQLCLGKQEVPRASHLANPCATETTSSKTNIRTVNKTN